VDLKGQPKTILFLHPWKLLLSWRKELISGRDHIFSIR